MIALRTWQKECIDAALNCYSNGGNHFLVMATPGAGKTTMASCLAKKLFDLNFIDIVICFTPSLAVTESFVEELTLRTERPMAGMLGSSGQAMTYHNLAFLKQEFWTIFETNRVLVIFDEIHHCAGQEINKSNSWGETILSNIQSKAACTLALTGTPWRSDKLPVTLANYCSTEGHLRCDYIYGLQRAIREKVCRVPQIIAIDNNLISYNEEGGSSIHYDGIEPLLSNESVPFQHLLDSEPLVKFVLQQAVFKLSEIRYSHQNAAGLVIASSVPHAHRLAAILKDAFNESVVVVTHKERNAASILNEFKEGTQKWIVAVGMVSEGTNIPRLQVCCHLTRIKTELHFRQVLGRVLRANGEGHNFAYLYILAEKTLLDFANRIEQDLPNESSVLHIEKIEEENAYQEVVTAQNHKIQEESVFDDDSFHLSTNIPISSLSFLKGESGTLQTNRFELGIFGKYLTELLAVQNSFIKKT